MIWRGTKQAVEKNESDVWKPANIGVCCDGPIAGINYVPPLEGNKEGNPDWFGTGEEIRCVCIVYFVLCDDVVCGHIVLFSSLVIQSNQTPCSCYPQWFFRTQFLLSRVVAYKIQKQASSFQAKAFIPTTKTSTSLSSQELYRTNIIEPLLTPSHAIHLTD